MKSMTGFGKAETSLASHLVRCEVKSLNARNLEITTKFPNGLIELEAQVHKYVKQEFQRGKILITLNLTKNLQSSQNTSLFDKETAASVYKNLLAFAQEVQAPAPDLSLLFQWDVTPQTVFSEKDLSALFQTVVAALDQMGNSREQEGQALWADFSKYQQQLQEKTEAIEKLAPQQIQETQSLFQDNLAKLLGNDRPVDENRLTMECAVFAEKLDISEEITRLKHHIATFAETIQQESVGKRIGFLVQELHRETNTIASKSNYLPILQTALAMKEIIEKIREQISNVE